MRKTSRSLFTRPPIALVSCLLLLTVSAASASAPARHPFLAPPASSSELPPADPETTGESPEIKKNLPLAMGELVLVNLFVWSYDRYIREGGGKGFRVGFNSWWDNIQNGWEWDPNHFNTNQFAHPYHGSLYYSAGRANGFTYWESIPFAFAGSYMWEYFGETHNASFNDWISTSVGGTALGEVLFRFSDAILDNTATGSGRNGKEFAGFLVNPVRGFTRLVNGDMFRVHENDPNRLPGSFGIAYEVGYRTVAEGKIADADSGGVFMDLAFDYGDPFAGDIEKPFDHFDFGVQLNFNDKKKMGRVQAKGLLHGGYMSESEGAKHLLAGIQHFDYINTTAYEFGGQSLGAAWLSEFRTGEHTRIRGAVHGSLILLGGTTSDYANISGRSYDYGPGAGYKIQAQFDRKNRRMFLISHEGYWIHALDGTRVDHYANFTRLKLDVPITQGIGAGVDYLLYLSESYYKDYPDVSSRFPELRAYFSWVLK